MTHADLYQLVLSDKEVALLNIIIGQMSEHSLVAMVNHFTWPFPGDIDREGEAYESVYSAYESLYRKFGSLMSHNEAKRTLNLLEE